MKTFDADLHFHGLYSGGVSKNMLVKVIAEQAKLKGLDIVCTADILHKKWFEQCKKEIVEVENNVFKHREFNTYFIIGTEVECSNRIHHLVFLPDFESAETLKEKLKGTALFDCFGCGRPKIVLNAEQIAEKVLDSNGIIGPAHAFTPYFSVYAHTDSVQKSYGALAEEIHFIELGLSADSYFADLIKENHEYQFLTASDSHSPWPYRIGREFTRFKLKKPAFSELKKAFEKKDEKRIVLNVGLNPKEGKYHCTACNKCFAKYSLEDALKQNWRCLKCNGIIKKGVRDRILELATYDSEIHPNFRPEYIHSIPLAEIIADALNVQQINSQKVQALWREFIDSFNSEISVLVDEAIAELCDVNERVARKIEAFRNGWVHYIPGGGGNYGKPIICTSKEEFEAKAIELKEQLECRTELEKQKTLFEY